MQWYVHCRHTVRKKWPNLSDCFGKKINPVHQVPQCRLNLFKIPLSLLCLNRWGCHSKEQPPNWMVWAQSRYHGPIHAPSLPLYTFGTRQLKVTGMCANTESKLICSSTISPPSLRFFGGTDQWLVRDDVITKGKRRIDARDQKVRFAGIVPIWCLVSIDNVWRVSHQFDVYWQLRHLVARLKLCGVMILYDAQHNRLQSWKATDLVS